MRGRLMIHGEVAQGTEQPLSKRPVAGSTPAFTTFPSCENRLLVRGTALNGHFRDLSPVARK